MKYKVFGLGLILFIIIMAATFFLPKGKINPRTFSLKNTDSIHIQQGLDKINISKSLIKKISIQLMKMERIDVDRRVNNSQRNIILITQFSKNTSNLIR
jgi:hypothetical protein